MGSNPTCRAIFLILLLLLTSCKSGPVITANANTSCDGWFVSSGLKCRFYGILEDVQRCKWFIDTGCYKRNNSKDVLKR